MHKPPYSINTNFREVSDGAILRVLAGFVFPFLIAGHHHQPRVFLAHPKQGTHCRWILPCRGVPCGIRAVQLRRSFWRSSCSSQQVNSFWRETRQATRYPIQAQGGSGAHCWLAFWAIRIRGKASMGLTTSCEAIERKNIVLFWLPFWCGGLLYDDTR